MQIHEVMTHRVAGHFDHLIQAGIQVVLQIGPDFRRIEYDFHFKLRRIVNQRKTSILSTTTFHKQKLLKIVIHVTLYQKIATFNELKTSFFEQPFFNTFRTTQLVSVKNKVSFLLKSYAKSLSDGRDGRLLLVPSLKELATYWRKTVESSSSTFK